MLLFPTRGLVCLKFPLPTFPLWSYSSLNLGEVRALVGTYTYTYSTVYSTWAQCERKTACLSNTDFFLHTETSLNAVQPQRLGLAFGTFNHHSKRHYVKEVEYDLRIFPVT